MRLPDTLELLSFAFLLVSFVVLHGCKAGRTPRAVEKCSEGLRIQDLLTTTTTKLKKGKKKRNPKLQVQLFSIFIKIHINIVQMVTTSGLSSCIFLFQVIEELLNNNLLPLCLPRSSLPGRTLQGTAPHTSQHRHCSTESSGTGGSRS